MAPARFTVERRYDWDADRHFAAIIRFDELAEAMEGHAEYQGLPSGAARVGQVAEVRIKLFGWLPVGSWRMEILERDDAERRLRSSERGGAVKTWLHTITVEPQPDGCCLHRDALEIDAGWLTGLYTAMAKRMYKNRHDQRQALRERMK